MNGFWEIRFKPRLFRSAIYQVGWSNRSGFAPVAEYATREEAVRCLEVLEQNGRVISGTGKP